MAKTLYVTIKCKVTSITNATCITSFTYNYGSPTANVNFPTYTSSPACPGLVLSYALSLQAGGTIPAAFSLDQTNKKFVVTTLINIPSATYSFKMTVTHSSGSTN